MNLLFLSSGGPGNLRAALDLGRLAPGLVRVGMVCADRGATPAIALAERLKIAAYVADFRALCGEPPAQHDPGGRALYADRAEHFHDEMLEAVLREEVASGWPFDLVVLAYRRIIAGRFLQYFSDRIINQHPSDLARLDGFRRRYVGIGGHRRSLLWGEGGARTSTILVTGGIDSGEILCQGPFVPFTGEAGDRKQTDAHEQLQKRASDWPSLSFALVAIATGDLAISLHEMHTDGRRVVYLDGRPLPYAGFSCARDNYPHRIAARQLGRASAR